MKPPSPSVAITIVVDPFPSDAAMDGLWQSAWGDTGRRNWAPVLQRSLVHVGAFAGDDLVGFVNVAWDGGVHAFLLDTSVHAAFQRRGIATRVVAKAADVAGERGAQWLHVDFEPHLRGFYHGCGFRPTEAGLIQLANT